jgi:transcriptional regulator with XRE-family HTH domain
MEVRQRLAQNVQRERHAKGWSQEELADRAQLHRTYISGVERGVRNPTITVVEKIAAALETTAAALVS